MKRILVSLTVILSLLCCTFHISVSADPGIDDYAPYLESKHFIFDESLYQYLQYVSPQNFKVFMDRMDMAYEAMLDLIGSAPCEGTKITMRYGEHQYGFMFVNIGEPSIYWTDWGPLAFMDIYPDNWYHNGAIHELAHVFQERLTDTWACWGDVEGWAQYISWLAIEYCGGSILYSTGYLTGIELIEHDISFYEYIFSDPDYEILFYGETAGGGYAAFPQLTAIHPISQNLGFGGGWEVLQKVFRSYHDNGESYRQREYDFDDIRQVQLADFIDRCSFFAGVDITEVYWRPATKEQYAKNLYPELKIEYAYSIGSDELAVKFSRVLSDGERIVAAAYDINGKLVGTGTKTALGESKTVLAIATEPKSAVYNVKIAVWDGTSTMVPLCPSFLMEF